MSRLAPPAAGGLRPEPAAQFQPKALIAGAIPAMHMEEAVQMLAHDDARRYNLELETWGGVYGARIYPPSTAHLRCGSRLSGTFYGCGHTPSEAVQRAVEHFDDFRRQARMTHRIYA